MAQYQNIFTQVQVAAPPIRACRCSPASCDRGSAGRFIHYLLGKHRRRAGRPDLSRLSSASLSLDLRLHRLRDHRPQHVGLGELEPVQFVRQLPWLALEPPPPEYGLHAFRRCTRAAGG